MLQYIQQHHKYVARITEGTKKSKIKKTTNQQHIKKPYPQARQEKI